MDQIDPRTAASVVFEGLVAVGPCLIIDRKGIPEGHVRREDGLAEVVASDHVATHVAGAEPHAAIHLPDEAIVDEPSVVREVPFPTAVHESAVLEGRAAHAEAPEELETHTFKRAVPEDRRAVAEGSLSSDAVLVQHGPGLLVEAAVIELRPLHLEMEVSERQVGPGHPGVEHVDLPEPDASNDRSHGELAEFAPLDLVKCRTTWLRGRLLASPPRRFARHASSLAS